MAQPHFRIIFQFLATKMGELPAKATIGIGSKVVSLARLIIPTPISLHSCSPIPKLSSLILGIGRAESVLIGQNQYL